MNVIVLMVAFDLVKVFALRVTLGRATYLQQMPKVFDRAKLIFSRVFDSCSLFD